MKVTVFLALLTSAVWAEPVPIFDGKTLAGWEVRPGEEQWWKVQDGMITGGSLEQQVPHNTFLATNKRYANFDLRLKLRLVKGEGFMNSGVQIRSIRVPGDSEMSGYQVDAGPGWWGKLYDESRRNKVIGEPVDPAASTSPTGTTRSSRTTRSRGPIRIATRPAAGSGGSRRKAVLWCVLPI